VATSGVVGDRQGRRDDELLVAKREESALQISTRIALATISRF
jgi:hypothetical protein